MEPLRLLFNNAKFQYLLSREVDCVFNHSVALDDGYHLSYTASTRVLTQARDGKRVSIIGFCVDAHGELARESLPDYLLDTVDSLKALLDSSARLAGKYVIVFQNRGLTHVVGDATCSLPVYYTTDKGGVCISSSAYMTGRCTGNKLSEEAIRARRGSGLDQAIPYDVTLYDGILSLLPNYYLDVAAMQARRYFPTAGTPVQRLPLETVVERSVALIGNIVREYAKHYELVCPLTSGWDSRVVYAFLKRQTDVTCYTFRHSRFSRDAAELVVPRVICERYGSPHQLVEVETAPEQLRGDLKNIIGGFHDAGKVNLAYTYRKNFGERALINGEIIGQIGKSSLFNAVPSWLSPNSFFVTKTHNYSSAGWRLTAAHLKDIRDAAKGSVIFDLFSWENRCGRWAAQSSEVYGACGINMLNIFNCSEIIRMWVGVPSALRVDQRIHVGILEQLDTGLLAFPCNPDSRTDWLRKNSYVYFLASHIKYGLGGVKRLAGA